MVQAIVNAQVFDGESLLPDHAVLIENARVLAVIDSAQIPANVSEVYDLKGGTLVPGFIDLQVNGGGGALFTQSPTIDSLRTISAAHRQFGTTGFLPTVITSSLATLRRAVTAVSEAITLGVPGILGIHLEGPFLNPERRGMHDARMFRSLDEEGFEVLTSLERGKTIVTLAPELTDASMIRRLVQKGVIVCAGHSAANHAQTRAALAAGLSGFTHLYNAMTPLQSREPGMVGAALDDENSWFGIIADGYHVHPASFGIAVTAKKNGGAILVTDAMPMVGSSEHCYALDGEILTLKEGRVTNSAGTLAGSALDMLSAVNNAAAFARIDWFEAVRMASLYPARALGLEREMGAIRAGQRANLVELNSKRHILATWVDGFRA